MDMRRLCAVRAKKDKAVGPNTQDCRHWLPSRPFGASMYPIVEAHSRDKCALSFPRERAILQPLDPLAVWPLDFARSNGFLKQCDARPQHSVLDFRIRGPNELL